MAEEVVIVEDACRDEPKETDWKREDVFGEEVAEGAKQFVKWPDEVPCYNQNKDPKTLKGCVGYASANIVNANQTNEWKNNGIVFEQEDPKYYWFRFQQHRGWLNSGSSLQEHLSFLKNIEKSIEGFVVVHTVEQMRAAINGGYFILTGSDKGDWTATGKTGVFTIGGLKGHGVLIGKDDEPNQCFWGLNSFGEGWGPYKGWFKIPYNMINHLFSKYAIIDSDSTGKMQSYKFEKDFQKAIELGITNGVDPDKPTTRKEAAVMAYRAYKA